MLEDALIATCARFDVAAHRGESIGVWVGPRKIASIGIGVRRGVAYHGIALNVSPDLRFFEAIVPCREAGLRFTSLTRVMEATPAMKLVAQTFRDCFADVFGYPERRSVAL
jgi:lipoate-protein ligase B